MDERRLKLLLATFFVALAIPSVVLVVQAHRQLKWESFRQTEQIAEDLAARIDADLRMVVAAEEARSFGDFAFLVVEGDASANFVQRSPLSSFPVESAVPGAIGYFQVDANGELTTPLLPNAGVDAERYGIPPDERQARLELETSIRNVLIENRLVERPAPERLRRLTSSFDESELSASDAAAEAGSAAPADAAPPAAVFDELALSAARVSGATTTAAEKNVAPLPRQYRTEQALVAEPAAEQADASETEEAPAAGLELRVRTFESELEPFEVGLLDTGHLVLFRSAWRDGERYIQGVLVDRERFVARAVNRVLAGSSLAGVSRVIPTYGGEAIGVSSVGREPWESAASAAAGAESLPAGSAGALGLAGSLLHRARMSPPFGNLELVFTADTLPRAPGSLLLGWISVILAIVLCGGFALMYRFAVGQLRLSRQQQDFVSAVSHELKTPLTSIRMYGEMLKAGWADEARKQVYYDYIHGEAERLSRLIENVLQLARLTRQAPQLDMRRVTASELFDLVRSKVGTQIEHAGFRLELHNDAPEATLTIDPDCFIQIMINLVDNALKFAASAERKVIEIACRERDGDLLVTVRDFGPGIAKGQMKKIFGLFYRPEDTLTRETVGTGIGLALVQQLVAALGGRVEARNCSPGAELRLTFPARALGS